MGLVLYKTKSNTRKKWTLSRVIQKASEFGLEYIEGFVKSSEKCLFRCTKEDCGWVGYKIPSNLKIGGGGSCPRCCGKERVSLDRIIHDARKLNLEYLSGYVVGFSTTKDKVTYRCLVEGCGWKGYKTPSDVKSGYGCVRCGGRERLSIGKIKAAAERIGLLYVSGYTSFTNKALYKCTVVGCGWEGQRTPHSVSKGKGCKRCMRNEPLSMDRLQADAVATGLEYLYGYTNVMSPAFYRCVRCGNVEEKTPDNVRSGRGCTVCKRGGSKSNKPAYFYVYDLEGIVGYGITCNFEFRHAQHQRTFKKFNLEFDVMYVGRFGSGLEAKKLEKYLKNRYAPVSKVDGFKTESAKGEHLNEILEIVKDCVDRQSFDVVKYQVAVS